ncbi:FHA domain-containing protein [Actinomycetospora succinea]|uniref:FHA domain-containing protein n=1 Tax=Actinomycetospora succinea TaxID=663603 RepID=A0A4R6VHI4_9PSEU|nr:FHA domain-containing protein [Actinomycetospora succinea]TDQ60784.1 FHA domain-containing protein [Actinomycetospora succinea]
MSDDPPADAPADVPADAPAEVPGGAWVVTVWADRDYHDLVLARRGPDDTTSPGEFPADVEPREVRLVAEETRVGRGGDPAARPEIDLGERDPGVSKLHAVLLALPRDRWVVIDAGSTNGTTLNYAEDPLTPDTPVALRSGDRIHVGAWTTLTVERR